MRINVHLLQAHMTVKSGRTQHSRYVRAATSSKSTKPFPKVSKDNKNPNVDK